MILKISWDRTLSLNNRLNIKYCICFKHETFIIRGGPKGETIIKKRNNKETNRYKKMRIMRYWIKRIENDVLKQKLEKNVYEIKWKPADPSKGCCYMVLSMRRALHYLYSKHLYLGVHVKTSMRTKTNDTNN